MASNGAEGLLSESTSLNGSESRLVGLSCSEFASELAAREPVPGGGGAAALVGALAAALCSMVGNFTVGKARYANVEEDVRRLLAEADDTRRRLLELVDEDARAFAPLSRAYAIPREDPTRPQRLEEATRDACKAPLAMMEQCSRVIELLEEMAEKGSRMLLSDVACGAYLARAALEAASVNVLVNTSSLGERSFAQDAESRCDALLAEYVPRAEALGQETSRRIRGVR